VFARSTTVRGQTQSIDAGIANIRDEVMPTVLGIDGCVGMSLLVDRDSGRCIATTAWQSREAMRSSESRVRSLRENAARMLGGTPQVDEWEIALLHRDHTSRPGACVRTTWVRMEPGQVDRALDVYRMAILPRVEELPGFCSASLMVDREAGRGVSSVTLDSRAALDRSREDAARAREAGAREAGVEIVEVGEFELALAHLRVPEMA
jgi:hypothetical protein